MSETVLVTGGAGYIGSHACKALALAGYRPVAYDNLVHGHRWAVRWGPLEEGELADGERLDAVIQAHRPTAVLHFAAYTAAGESVAEPGKYYANNVYGLLSLLGAMRRARLDRLVFSSTAAVYGPPRHRSEERRVGTEGVSTLRSRWAPVLSNTNKKKIKQ